MASAVWSPFKLIWSIIVSHQAFLPFPCLPIYVLSISARQFIPNWPIRFLDHPTGITTKTNPSSPFIHTAIDSTMSTDHDPKAKAEDVYGKANAAMLKGVPALMAIPVIRSACDDVERQYLEVKQAEKTHSEYTEDKDTIIEKMRAALAGKGGVDPSSPVKRKIVGEVSKYDRTVHNLVGQIANLKEGLEYLRLKLQDELAAQKAKKEEEEKAKKVAAVDAELMGLLAELEAEHALDEESHIHTINSDDTAHTDNKDDPSKKLLIDFVSKVGPSTPSDGSNVAVDDSSPFSSPSEGSPPWKEKTLAAAQSEPPRDDENASVSKKLTLETTGKFSLGNAGANGNVGGTLETPSSTKKAAIKKPGDDLETPASARKAATKNAAAKKAGDDLGTPSSAKKPSGASTSGALANLINLDDLMTENHPNKNAGMPLRATTTTKDATGTGRLLGGPPVDIVVDPDSEGDDAVSQLSMGTVSIFSEFQVLRAIVLRCCIISAILFYQTIFLYTCTLLFQTNKLRVRRTSSFWKMQ